MTFVFSRQISPFSDRRKTVLRKYFMKENRTSGDAALNLSQPAQNANL
jgi:hypothetical protein